MAIQLLINIFIAFLWMFLQDSFSVLTFILGFFVGMFIIFSMRRFFPGKFYVRMVGAVFLLFLLFISESIMSTVDVIKQVLKPKIDITPGIFKLETDLKSDLEITLLAILITLTPGSVVMEVSPDHKTFYIHGLNLPESISSVKKSKLRFERAIKEVTR